MDFGTRLKAARKNKKLTQLKSAEKIGIDDTTLSKYENNHSEPDNETLRKLADLYEVSFDWLLGKVNGRKELSDKQKKMIDEFNKLSQEDQEYVMGLIERIKKQ